MHENGEKSELQNNQHNNYNFVLTCIIFNLQNLILNNNKVDQSESELQVSTFGNRNWARNRNWGRNRNRFHKYKLNGEGRRYQWRH